jgi:hypothetical protein
VITGWKNKKHEEYRQSICGQRQAKRFLKRASADSYSTSAKNQLRIMTRFLRGHCN